MPDKITYLNTASCGLLSPASLQNTNAFFEAMQVNASGRSEYWRSHELQPLRETLAKFMDAPVQNVAFIPNFTFGLTCIVHSLRGDEKVLLYRNDFPSVAEPFRINGFDISWVDSRDGFTILVDEIKELLVERKIEVFVISHVQYASGFKIDIYELAAFCRQYDILFIVDATQSLGAVELSVKQLGADAVIASNYKWMNAGLGSGVMYISDNLLEKYTPRVAGFGSYTMAGDKMYYEPSARSFEPGHLNVPVLLLLGAAMKEKFEKGLPAIGAHNRQLTAKLLAVLQKYPVSLLGGWGMEDRASIVMIKDEGGLGAHLEKNGIIVTHRGGYLRISIHFYNTSDDIARLENCLAVLYSGKADVS